MAYDPKSRFDYACKEDKRVEAPSPYALDYPRDIDQAPDGPGVFMLLDIIDYVLYIGMSSGTSLKEAIKRKAGSASEKDAKKFRWFKTGSEAVASELEAEWIKKFDPRNNRAEKEQGQQQGVGAEDASRI